MKRQASSRDVGTRITGPFDDLACRRLERTVTLWCAPPVVNPGTAHVDLAGVTHLSAAAAEFLDEMHRRLAVVGWTFRVDPPDDAEARRVFVNAAIRGTFGWVGAPCCVREANDDETA